MLLVEADGTAVEFLDHAILFQWFNQSTKLAFTNVPD